MRIDPLDPLQRTPLHYAAEKGHADTVRALLAAGANPKQVDGPNGDAPLHLAAKHGHAAVVELLVEYGSPVSLISRQRSTALILAIAGGHREVVERLLSKGADPNSIGPLGLTALQRAVYWRHLDIADLLVLRGARMDIHSAAGMNRADLVANFLAEDASQIERLLPNGTTPLHVAARCGAADTANLLIARKAKVEAVDTEYQTPLRSAAAFGHLNIATILLDAGARVNVDAGGKGIDQGIALIAAGRPVQGNGTPHPSDGQLRVVRQRVYRDRVRQIAALDGQLAGLQDGGGSDPGAPFGGTCSTRSSHIPSRPAGMRRRRRKPVGSRYTPAARKSERLRQSMVAPAPKVCMKSCRVAPKKSLAC
jgi:ankyrin repeat protein